MRRDHYGDVGLEAVKAVFFYLVLPIVGVCLFVLLLIWNLEPPPCPLDHP